MKVFISQPMRGKTDQEIKDARADAINTICRMYQNPHNIEVLDTFFENYNGSAVQFLGKSLVALGEADLAVFLPGWNLARGCRIEELVANTYEIDCVYL